VCAGFVTIALHWRSRSPRRRRSASTIRSASALLERVVYVRPTRLPRQPFCDAAPMPLDAPVTTGLSRRFLWSYLSLLVLRRSRQTRPPGRGEWTTRATHSWRLTPPRLDATLVRTTERRGGRLCRRRDRDVEITRPPAFTSPINHPRPMRSPSRSRRPLSTRTERW